MVTFSKSAIYDGSKFGVSIIIDDEQWLLSTQSGFSQNDPAGEYLIVVTLEDGQIQTKNGNFTKVGAASFSFDVEKKKSFNWSASINGKTFFWFRSGGSAAIGSNPFSTTLNGTETNIQTLANTLSVQTQIVNSSYKQDAQGTRNYKFDVNYTINDLAGVPLGTKFDMFVQFSTLGGLVTNLLTIPRTFNLQSGVFPVSIFDNSPFNTLPDNIMRVEVFFWLKDRTAISPQVGDQQDLVITEPPPLVCDVGFHEENGVCVPDIIITQNKKFELVFVDNGVIAYILNQSEFDIFIANQEFPTVVIRNIIDTTLQAGTLQQLRNLIIAKLNTIPDIPEDTVNATMITQTVEPFEIIDGRIKGSIFYSADLNFNPFWFGKQISSFVQIKSDTGVPLIVKENKLTFTQSERTERINIDELAGNFSKLIVEFFVWVSVDDNRAFSDPKQITVQVGSPPPPDPAPIPQKKDSFFGALKGILVGSLALSLLASKK